MPLISNEISNKFVQSVRNFLSIGVLGKEFCLRRTWMIDYVTIIRWVTSNYLKLLSLILGHLNVTQLIHNRKIHFCLETCIFSLAANQEKWKIRLCLPMFCKKSFVNTVIHTNNSMSHIDFKIFHFFALFYELWNWN